MPSEEDKPPKKVKLVKPKPKSDEEAEASKSSSPSQRPMEIQLVPTRVARDADHARSSEEDDPAERLGMSKIGASPKGPLPEPKPQEQPGPEEGAAEEEEEEFAGSEEVPEEPPVVKGAPPGRLPPPPIPPKDPEEAAQEEAAEKEDAVLDETLNKDPEVEYDEVTIAGGKKIKVLRVKRQAPPPPDEEGGDVEEPLMERRPLPGRELRVDRARERPAVGSRAGIKELNIEEEPEIKRPPRGGTIRRQAGLGVDVELDESAIRKLSAPVLPAEFDYPKRAFHSRIMRLVLMCLLPVLMLVIVFAYDIVNTATLFAVFLISLMFLMMLMIFGVSPFYANHLVTKTHIILKHGVYFEVSIPLEAVIAAKVYEERAGELGIRFGRDHRLYAMSDRKDMVLIDLKVPTNLGSYKDVESIVTNVEQPSRFVRTVKSAVKAWHEDRSSGTYDGPEGDGEESA